MANYTPNLNLGKPESSDEFGDFLDLFNDNMDILDQGGGGGSSVTWTQIQQSGTKIAEIDINGTSQDVYAPQGGGSSDIVELTQAEYDALPDTKLTDDTMYLIKDGESAEDKIPDELNDLSDVNISSATNLQGLVYDNITQKWVNGYPNGVVSKNGLTQFQFDATLSYTADVEYYGTMTYKGSGKWEFGATEPLFKVINGELCQVYDDGN